MHFAVATHDRAARVDHDHRVVVQALGALFEDRTDDRNVFGSREFAERFACGSGDRFGPVESLGDFALAWIWRDEEFLKTHQFSPVRRGLLDPRAGLREICGDIACCARLD